MNVRDIGNITTHGGRRLKSTDCGGVNRAGLNSIAGIFHTGFCHCYMRAPGP